MDVLDQSRQFREGPEQIVAKSDRVRGRKAQAFQTIDSMNGFEQLNERTLAVDGREFVPAIQIHDLTQKRDFFHSARDESSYFAYDFVDRTAALRTARPGHDAKGAMHVAPLHDRNKRGRLPLLQLVIANRFGRAEFFLC